MSKCIGIIGYGNAGAAISAHLSKCGKSVFIYNRTEDKLRVLRESRSIKCEGLWEGRFPISGVTTKLSEVFRCCDKIIIAVPANAHRDISYECAPHTGSRHSIMLLSGKMGGCMEFEKIARENSRTMPQCIIEGDSIYACRKTGPDSINIRGKKEWVLVSGSSREQTMMGYETFKKYFSCLYPADNFVQRGLSDLGAYVHPVVMLLNCGSIERGESFLFYRKGVTEAMRGILSAMDEERRHIASAYNTTVKTLAEMVRSYYPETPDMEGDIINTLKVCPTYKNSISPDTINHRYLIEDVLMSLYPAKLLAKRAGVPTPAINAMIEFTRNILNLDLEAEGRTPEKLGVSDNYILFSRV